MVLNRFSPLLLALVALAGCRTYTSEVLYALPLQGPPTEQHWQQAMPVEMHVTGGRPHRPEAPFSMDQDMVHLSTASCHHGEVKAQPVIVEVRAYYSPQDLFLRLRWEDPTRDDAMMSWIYQGEFWQNKGGLEDGLGILWAPADRYDSFNCAYACHMEDFGVSRSAFRSRNLMRLSDEGTWLDLWNWKADRTAGLGFADDGYLDSLGTHPDYESEIFHPNSANARSTDAGAPFSQGDRPLYVRGGAEAAGTGLLGVHDAPGYLVDRPAQGRADVLASSVYEDGGWTLTLRRALDTGDPRDIVFTPGEAPNQFDLSVFDNSTNAHYIGQGGRKLALVQLEKI